MGQVTKIYIYRKKNKKIYQMKIKIYLDIYIYFLMFHHEKLYIYITTDFPTPKFFLYTSSSNFSTLLIYFYSQNPPVNRSYIYIYYMCTSFMCFPICVFRMYICDVCAFYVHIYILFDNMHRYDLFNKNNQMFSF